MTHTFQVLEDMRSSRGPARKRQKSIADATSALSDSSAPDRSSCANTAFPWKLTNEQLAHELLLDPAFTLDEFGGNSRPLF
jgi:hypothetical protein